MANPQDLAVLRQALVRELETVNHYQDMHDRATDPAVKQLMLHLMDEEKEHVAELTAMLRTMDDVQDRFFKEGHGEALARGDVAALAEKPSPSKPASPRSGWTVGSLMGPPHP